jgi:Fe2+ transport system protein FeoA
MKKQGKIAVRNKIKPFGVIPGKKFSIRQLQGTYGPFLIKTAHYDIYQENC